MIDGMKKGDDRLRADIDGRKEGTLRQTGQPTVRPVRRVPPVAWQETPTASRSQDTSGRNAAPDAQASA